METKDQPDGDRRLRLHDLVEEMFSLLEEAVPGGVGQSEWPRWRERAVRVVEHVTGPDWLEQRIAPRDHSSSGASPAPSLQARLDRDLLRRIEANMAWLLRTAGPQCGSEPESYDLADAIAVHAELRAILLETTANAA